MSREAEKHRAITGRVSGQARWDSLSTWLMWPRRSHLPSQALASLQNKSHDAHLVGLLWGLGMEFKADPRVPSPLQPIQDRCCPRAIPPGDEMLWDISVTIRYLRQTQIQRVSHRHPAHPGGAEEHPGWFLSRKRLLASSCPEVRGSGWGEGLRDRALAQCVSDRQCDLRPRLLNPHSKVLIHKCSKDVPFLSEIYDPNSCEKNVWKATSEFLVTWSPRQVGSDSPIGRTPWSGHPCGIYCQPSGAHKLLWVKFPAKWLHSVVTENLWLWQTYSES